MNISQKLILAVVALVGTLAVSYFILQASFLHDGLRYFVLKDDFMISMRYAYNLAHGNGLVWNSGDRIEGISDLGWTLLMSALHVLPLPLRFMSLAVEILNCIFFAGIIYLCFSHARRLLGNWAAVTTAAVITFAAPLAYYAICGSEHILQSLLVSACLLPLIPSPRNLPSAGPCLQGMSFIWLALACLIRPDALAIFAFVTAAWLAAFINTKWRGAISFTRKDIVLFMASCAIIGAMLIFQRLYYGQWLPNTFYLKAVGGAVPEHALVYILYCLSVSPPIIFLESVCGALAYLGWKANRNSNSLCAFQAGTLLSLTLIWFAYIISIGGDWFPMGRFFLPLLPTWIVCTIALAFALTKKSGNVASDIIRRSSIFILSAGAIGAILFYPTMLNSALESVRIQGQTSAAIAEDFEKNNLDRNVVIALHQAGSLPYFLPQYRFHDLLGKSDYVIARSPWQGGLPGHAKWNYSYSLDKLQPTVLIVSQQVPGLTDKQLQAMLVNPKELGPKYYAAMIFNQSFIDHYQGHPYKVHGEPNIPCCHQLVFLRDRNDLPQNQDRLPQNQHPLLPDRDN